LLLYFIFCSNGGSTLPKGLDILSIAFGSPFVADNEIRKWLRERQNLARCFWSFVHKNDGVPRSLNLVDNIAGQNSPVKQIYDKVITFVETLGLVFPEIRAVEKYAGYAKHLYEEFSKSPTVQKNVSELYQPFGLWLFCEKSGYTSLDSSRQPDDIVEKLGETQLTVRSIRDHSIDEYYAVLNSALDFSNITSIRKADFITEGFVIPGEDIEITVKKSNRFFPKIKAVKAELHESDKPRVVIHITGENLNFLSEPAVELEYFTSNIVYLAPAKTSSKELLMNSHSLIIEGNVPTKELSDFKILLIKHFFFFIFKVLLTNPIQKMLNSVHYE
jgi:hypothetical protein